ncbi:unnamed protein product [Cuscuta europaea]|uniref:Uncharacterized protein n=1 Tax=Cuscuta europaea TaxID=41803 RepID=A0A9P0YPS6_CUSEU|nr:unnamed protein product [Cuscuta europaea]
MESVTINNKTILTPPCPMGSARNHLPGTDPTYPFRNRRLRRPHRSPPPPHRRAPPRTSSRNCGVRCSPQVPRRSEIPPPASPQSSSSSSSSAASSSSSATPSGTAPSGPCKPPARGNA